MNINKLTTIILALLLTNSFTKGQIISKNPIILGKPKIDSKGNIIEDDYKDILYSAQLTSTEETQAAPLVKMILDYTIFDTDPEVDYEIRQQRINTAYNNDDTAPLAAYTKYGYITIDDFDSPRSVALAVAPGNTPLGGYLINTGDLQTKFKNKVTYSYPGQISINRVIVRATDHLKNSPLSNYNKLTLKIVTLNSSGIPTNKVLWQQIDSTNKKIPPVDENLNNQIDPNEKKIFLYYFPNYTTKLNEKIAFVFEFEDKTKEDILKLFYISPYPEPTNTTYKLIDRSEYPTTFIKDAYYTSWTSTYTLSFPITTETGFYKVAYPLQQWWLSADISFYDIAANTNVAANSFKLGQNRPNPANESTTIDYEIEKNMTNITMEIIDITGKVIFSENLGNKQSGKYQLQIDTQKLVPGIYYYYLKSNNGSKSATNKLIVAR